ncbi:hypothetical protein MTO96_015318 [Rhipicephalus appendiculatus]
MCPNPLQNIMVVSTPSQENVRRYVNVEAITVAGQDHEVSAYVAAPHATCKGVIRGIPLSDGPEAIDRKIVNARNPLALGAKRIKSTGVIIVVFDGYKVPNYVSYGGTLIKCTLYRKQVDVCYACGRLGHRSDVCPTPDASVCRACRQAIQQEEDHGRTEATGTGPHPSPRADYGDANEDQGSRKSNLTWADRVRSNDGEQPMQCDPPQEHARDAEVSRLRKENSQLKDTVSKMTNEMAEIKRMLSAMQSTTERETLKTPVPAPVGDGPMATKRRAVVSKLKNTESQVEDIKQTLIKITENIQMVAGSVASLTESVRQMQAALSDPVEGLRGMNERIVALENHIKLHKSGPPGAPVGNVKIAMPATVDRTGVHQAEGPILQATLTSQGGDESRIFNGQR